jgi:hypothetical protein
VVARGQQAWGKIKATAAEQRQLWQEVGAALLVGKKDKNIRGGKPFIEWAKAEFNGLSESTIPDAIWWAGKSTAGVEIPSELTHPKRLREWFRENASAETLTEDLKNIQVVKDELPRIRDEREAARINKTSLRKKYGGEGSDIAASQLDALARKHSTTVEKLEEAAAAASPFTAFQFVPAQVQALTEFKQDLIHSYREMLSEGISKDAVVALSHKERPLKRNFLGNNAEIELVIYVPFARFQPKHSMT